MATKIFSIYKSGKERTTKNNDRLIVEISNHHVVSLVIGGATNQVEDFEWFDMNGDGFNNFEENFAYIVIGSRLLDKPYADKKVFINTSQAVLIPHTFYSKENSADYLNLLFGNTNEEIFKDDLHNQFQLVNAYRIPKHVREVIEKNLAGITLEHTFSSILRNLFWINSTLPAELLKVQFYKSQMIVVVVNDRQLQFVNAFNYATAEDALYNLLNVCKQFNLKNPSLQLSGAILTTSPLFEMLSVYFKNISTEEVVIQDLAIEEYPAHYFSPYFKLAE